MTWEALAPCSVHKADTVCHVPDGADGGVRGCERTSSAAVPAAGRVTGRWRRRSAPAGCRRDRRAVRSPRSGASRSVSARPGYAGIGDGGHGGQIGAGPHDLIAAGTPLPAGGDDLVADSAGGHGHGQVDVVVLAEEDPLEPVLLDPGQVPDEARAGWSRTAHRACAAARRSAPRTPGPPRRSPW